LRPIGFSTPLSTGSLSRGGEGKNGQNPGDAARLLLFVARPHPRRPAVLAGQIRLCGGGQLVAKAGTIDAGLPMVGVPFQARQHRFYA
jgi:hypothetical protein